MNISLISQLPGAMQPNQYDKYCNGLPVEGLTDILLKNKVSFIELPSDAAKFSRCVIVIEQFKHLLVQKQLTQKEYDARLEKLKQSGCEWKMIMENYDGLKELVLKNRDSRMITDNLQEACIYARRMSAMHQKPVVKEKESNPFEAELKEEEEKEVDDCEKELKNLKMAKPPTINDFPPVSVDEVLNFFEKPATIDTVPLEKVIPFIYGFTTMRDQLKVRSPDNELAQLTCMFWANKINARIAWGLPGLGTLDFMINTILEHYPKLGWINLGAGTGLLDALLAQKGGESIALEKTGFNKNNMRFFYQVQEHDDCLPIVQKYAKEKPLVIFWAPPNEPVGADAILAYEEAGGRLIFVSGNSEFTGDERMEEILTESGRWIQKIKVPQWAQTVDILDDRYSTLRVFVKV